MSCGRYALLDKNPSAWNFLSPEPEVTYGTVAIIIRVILLSPYLSIRGVSLSAQAVEHVLAVAFGNKLCWFGSHYWHIAFCSPGSWTCASTRSAAWADRETPRMLKYGESKMTQIMMATVPYVTSGSGLRKFRPMDFCLTECTYQWLRGSYCVHLGDRRVIYPEAEGSKLLSSSVLYYLSINTTTIIKYDNVQLLTGRHVSAIF